MERVEEIRRKWADDIRMLAEKPNACIDSSWEDIADVRDLLTALAQAEREWKQKNRQDNEYLIRERDRTEAARVAQIARRDEQVRLLQQERDAARAEVERLKEEKERGLWGIAENEIARLRNARDNAEAALARVRAALEPFANAAKELDRDEVSGTVRYGRRFVPVTAEDYFKARAALEGRG